MNTLSKRRSFVATVIALVLVLTSSPSVLSQHEGHDMKKPPAAKPKPKRTPAKRPQQPRTRRPASGRKAPSPTPTPTPHHTHETMPAPETPPPTPAASPTPPVHQHQMPETQTTHDTAHPPQEIKRPRRQVIPSEPILRLEDFEQMAAQRNPTLAQADAAIRAAEGRRVQAGLFPNPIVGYFLEEFAFRSPGETAEQGGFIEQTIPLGGKLSKARRVYVREKEQAVALAEAQRLRVTNSIRVLYLETLGAQRLVELRDDLSQLAREAVEITKELYNLGQADRPDQLEIEIEAERSEINFLRAQNDWHKSWRMLGAMVGNPDLPPARLAGTVDEELGALNDTQLLETMLQSSPEVSAARLGVERARAVLARARAERVPDLFFRGGLGYNYERFEPVVPSIADRRKGLEGRLEVGINVPIFNRNQGGIAEAEAELAIAERELDRLQLVLRSRFASSFREYRNAQQMVERYRTEVVPRAREAYEMYLSSFRQMAASYPQVLIAQRTLFQVEVEYARALVDLRQRAVSLRGFLLEGGLDPVGRPGEGTEGLKLRSPNEATGESDNP